MRNFADTGKRNPLRDHEQILRVENLIMYVTFGDDRLMGLGVARCRISHFSIDLRRRPYNTLALPCECVISTDGYLKKMTPRVMPFKVTQGYRNRRVSIRRL